MLMESDLLPYASAELPPGPWVVFAPHADDETFGMGGSLLLAQRQGIQVCVVFMTDGALGGDGDPGALVATRVTEATRATAELGISDLVFLAEGDRQLQVGDRLVGRVAEILRQRQPRSVFFPTPLEYHPDHRATAELVWRCLQRHRDLDIRAYSYEISTLAPINLLVDVTSVAERKYDVVRLYASQLTQAKYLALVQSVDTARTFSLPMDRVAAEGFFHFSELDASLQEQLVASVRRFFQGL